MENVWMTIKDLMDYLQLPESKVRSLVRTRQIPFHDQHGFLRFHREEIDQWMKTPQSRPDEEVSGFEYRGKPILEYMLTASKVLVGSTPLLRLPEFVRKAVEKTRQSGRDYLYRIDFEPFLNNFNDYLRVCCQIGLIEKQKGEGREKLYYPTDYARRVYSEDSPERVKEIVCDCILSIVGEGRETDPDERHAIFLLWYFLKIRETGEEPTEEYFRKGKAEASNYYPSIRAAFAKSLYEFLFDDNVEKATSFLHEWNKHL